MFNDDISGKSTATHPTVSVRVDLFSDYLCPWCWPAAVRLRALAERDPGAFTLRHRVFILLPEEQNRVFTPYYLQHRQAARRMTGLPYDLPPLGAPYPRSSLRALEAAQWMEAHHPERFGPFAQALFEAFFRDTRDISDSAVLAEIAGGIGIDETDRAKLTEALATRRLLRSVLDDYREALDAGVQSIPEARFIVTAPMAGAGERPLVSEQVVAVVRGAVSSADYEEALCRAQMVASGAGAGAGVGRGSGERRDALPMGVG